MSSRDTALSSCPHGIDAGAYVLHALSTDERTAYAAHVATCELCTAEVAALRQVADTLPMAAPQTLPPMALKSRIMTVVEAESQLLRAAGPEADRVPEAPRRRRWGGLTLGVRPAFAGALACAVLALGVVGGLLADDAASPETRTLAAEATGPAEASLEVTGTKASLQLTGMPSPPRGQVYQVWLERPGGQLQPSHTLFNVRADGRATVAIDESVEGVERILVTAEPSGGNLAPSSKPVIIAPIV